MSVSWSRLGIGTVQFGTDYGFTRAKTQAEVDEILDACLERGISLLDTAPAYGDSERKIGDYRKRRPGAQFALATKLRAFDPRRGARADARASVSASLEALGAAKLDLLQLHRCDEETLASDELWGALSDLRREGLVERLGVSVYEASEIESALARRPGLVDAVQLPYSIFDQRLRPWLARLRQAGIAVISRSTLLKGMIPALEDKLPPWLAGLKPAKARLRALAARAGLDEQSFALLSCAREPDIACTLIGVDSAAEVESAARAMAFAGTLGSLETELRALAVADPDLVDPRRWAERGFR